PSSLDEKYKSRYLDSQNAALFPFGHGLTYTRFEYSPATVGEKAVSAAALNAGKAQPIRVSAEVRNAGQVAGEEVVQLYIRQQGTSVARPTRELKGFQRIALAPGESKQVEFTIGRDELAFWNLDMKNAVEPARVTVWIAPSSALETTPAQFEVTPK
ncbi:MAG TPA: fibronectin type III-like domain-contianing protein, partial [Clostridia bacterium]|nr:fibronectin type III-like domain-contianing protein [Clostridia bacterium]